jgi:transcriptional regulator with XRE-family HTH domain
VALLIRTARARAGLSQDALAARMTAMGEPTLRSQISMWETKQMPSAAALIAIIEACVEAETPPVTEAERELDRLVEAFAKLGRPARRLPPPRDP